MTAHAAQACCQSYTLVRWGKQRACQEVLPTKAPICRRSAAVMCAGVSVEECKEGVSFSVNAERQRRPPCRRRDPRRSPDCRRRAAPAPSVGRRLGKRAAAGSTERAGARGRRGSAATAPRGVARSVALLLLHLGKRKVVLHGARGAEGGARGVGATLAEGGRAARALADAAGRRGRQAPC